MMKLGQAAMVSIISLVMASPAVAYPEFQAFIEKNSGRTVNCAMCHTNPDGPVGDGEGQLSSLNEKQLAEVNKGRSAIDPGTDVNSPIMNEFGNKLIKTIGMKKVLEAKTNPKLLAESLGNKSDLDNDGIPDAQEYLDGTDPANKFHGDPKLLFFANLERSKFHLIMALVATILIVYGFSNLIKALHIVSERRRKGD